MTQEPISGRYLPYIRPIFSGLNFREDPSKIWPKIWYVYVPPICWILEISHWPKGKRQWDVESDRSSWWHRGWMSRRRQSEDQVGLCGFPKWRYPLVMTNSLLLKMVIYSGFTHWNWWFSSSLCYFTRGYPLFLECLWTGKSFQNGWLCGKWYLKTSENHDSYFPMVHDDVGKILMICLPWHFLRHL